MADEKFVEFARHRLRFGTSKQDVAATLRINGLSEVEIEEVLTAAQTAPGTTESASTTSPTPTPPIDPLSATPPEEDPPRVVPSPTDVAPQPVPAQEMSHITVMPQMTPVVATAVETAPIAPRESFAPVVAALQQTPQVVATQAPAAIMYAGFWRRVLAACIDGVILTFAYAAVVIGVSLSLGTTEAASLLEYMQGAGGIITAVSLLVGVLYHPLLEASPMQGSLGKHFIGIFVTDMEGRRIGFWRALLRNLAKVTSSAILGIGYLMAAFTKQKQGLHDMIAGCLVLKHEHQEE